MSPDEIEKLTTAEAQDYIVTHAHEDEKKLLLQKQIILGIPTSLIVQQIAARRKAEIKLPQFYQTKGIIYPPSLNFEQCSSEATAKFKAEVIRKEIGENAKGTDLTCGFGIDSLYLSLVVESLHSVEPNADLLNIVRHNHSLLTKSISHHNKSAEDFLDAIDQKFDFVFVDPSRRDSKARKVFSLIECSPDITQLLPKVLTKTNFVLLKGSPLLDIKQGLKELNSVEKVIVVSVGNECKELLFQIRKDFAGEPLIETYNLDAEGKILQCFKFRFSEEGGAASKFNSPQKYLYEPNASILKSGAFKSIGEKFKLYKIQVNTHLYTSGELEKDFPGRVFEIEQLNFDPKSLAENKANIFCRNYPMTPEELKKKLKLKDGGEKFVIAFSGLQKKYVILGKRLDLSIESAEP